MSTLAVLGTGLLGAGFVEHMLALGHTVRVWNRTASRCAPLVEKGAVQADSPADAVRGAERVHLVLKADEAVDAVLAQLRPELGAGVPVLDHSTNLPARVAERAAQLRAEGVRYLHAPVFMGPGNAREGTGLMLLAGPRADVAELRDALETLTGSLIDLGERADKAAAMKVVGNSVLLMLTATMGDAFALGQAAGIEPQEILELFGTFGPTPAGMGGRILATKNRPVGFEATMARKDAQLMMDTATLRFLPLVAAVLDEGIAAGRGEEDFTALFRPAD